MSVERDEGCLHCAIGAAIDAIGDDYMARGEKINIIDLLNSISNVAVEFMMLAEPKDRQIHLDSFIAATRSHYDQAHAHEAHGHVGHA